MEQSMDASGTLTAVGLRPRATTLLASRHTYLPFPLLAACAFACLVYLWVPRQIADPDIWWHLRDAEMQWRSHAFMMRDVYSFTANGSAWLNHEWLAELPFYAGWRLLGGRGIFLITVLAIEAILLGVFYLAYRKSGDIAATMVASVLAALASTVSFGPRTLLFGWLCLVIELIILETSLLRMRYVWTLPFLFLAWVNLHGSWVIGIVVLLMFVFSTQVSLSAGLVYSERWPWRRAAPLMLSSGLSLAALFVNPYGWRLVAYPFDLAFRQKLNIGTVEEWKSLDFHSPRGKIFLASIGLMFLLQLIRSLQWSLYELLLVLLGVYAALTYSRFLFLAGIIMMPVLARCLPTQVRGKTSLYRGWMGAVVLLGILPLLVQRFPTSQSLQAGDRYPAQTLPFLMKLPQGTRVFNEFSWGGFLEWNTRQVPVFIDSRVDIFEYNGTFRDYLDVIQIKNSLDLLDRYKIEYVLFEPETPLTYLLEHNSGWKIAYRDKNSEILQRVGLEDGDVQNKRAQHGR